MLWLALKIFDVKDHTFNTRELTFDRRLERRSFECESWQSSEHLIEDVSSIVFSFTPPSSPRPELQKCSADLQPDLPQEELRVWGGRSLKLSQLRRELHMLGEKQLRDYWESLEKVDITRSQQV